MKILCFIESYLPGTKGGGPVRGLSNMVAQQSERHEFFILTRNHDYQDSKTYTHVESNQWIKNTGGAKVFYASDPNWRRASIEAIESLKPNWIYLSGAFSPMTRVLLSECKTNKALQNCKILLAPHGNLSPVALHHHFWRKYAWISYAKLRNLYSGISWHAASAREAAQISRSFGADEDIRKVPMAPALHDAFESEVTENREPLAPDMDSDFGQAVACFCLVYFGRLSPEKNLPFAFERLSEFARRHPNLQVRYDVIGSGMDEYVAQLKTLVEEMPPNLRIDFIGQLPSVALHAWLSGASKSHDASSRKRAAFKAMLMPSRTENFSYTILESLQAGIPVLVSDQTPWRDLSAKGVGWDLSLEALDPWRQALETLLRQSSTQEFERQQSALKFAKEWVVAYAGKATKLFD